MEITKAGERSREVRIPVTGGVGMRGVDRKHTHVRIGVAWTNGRGYTASVAPVHVDEQGTESFILTDMEFATVERAPRYSAKRLEALAAEMVASLQAGEGPHVTLLEKVLAKHELGREQASG